MSFPNRTAFIISHPQSITEILNNKPAGFHIYLIGAFQIRHPNVTLYPGTSLHDTAVWIAQEMLNRHLIHVISDEPAQQLKEKVAELLAGGGSFALGGAMLNALENLWRNLPFVEGSFSIDATRDLYLRTPAIIVASGPSLQRNIPILNELQDKAIIISCGSALGPLVRRNIVPHFEVVVDPNPAMYEVLKADLPTRTCMALSLMAHYRISQEFKGAKMYFMVNFDARVLEDIKRLVQIHTVLPAMASVATTALRFALHMGADPIIFVGQDLCYADGQTHIDGISSSADECMMQTLNGRTVRSNRALKEAFDYFAAFVPTITDRKIINATEGGAGIRGAEHMTLAEAAGRYLSRTITLPELQAQKVDVAKLMDRLKGLRGNFSAMHVKAAGFDRKIRGLMEQGHDESRINEKIVRWFPSLRVMSGYEYLAFYLDWAFYRADASAECRPKLELISMTKQILKRQIELIEELLHVLRT